MSDERKRRAKAKLRAEIRARRDRVSDAERLSAADLIGDRLVQAVGGRGTVMLFMSFGSEIPTDGLLERLAAGGHPLALPHIESAEMLPVAYESGEALEEVVWGIREPAMLRPLAPSDLDAVVTPGLAFDRAGYRVGYGGGFYDRLFQRTRPDVLRVGICMAWQLVDDVPHDRHDRRVDLVITEEGAIDVSGTR